MICTTLLNTVISFSVVKLLLWNEGGIRVD
jgi:hypothetical protein